MNSMAYAVEAEQLTRRFGDFIAVNNVSLKVTQGEIFGFLGANGAGKTTMIRMLCDVTLGAQFRVKSYISRLGIDCISSIEAGNRLR